MRLPRDLSGAQLVKALKNLGYAPTRQTGSHIRISTQENGEHHVTLHNHDSLRIGTLASILDDIARHFQISREELLSKINI